MMASITPPRGRAYQSLLAQQICALVLARTGWSGSPELAGQAAMARLRALGDEYYRQLRGEAIATVDQCIEVLRVHPLLADASDEQLAGLLLEMIDTADAEVAPR